MLLWLFNRISNHEVVVLMQLFKAHFAILTEVYGGEDVSALAHADSIFHYAHHRLAELILI